MELIRTVMLNVIVLVFFATVLDLLLPDSSFRSYIKMAMGFFAVLTMLQPIVQILNTDYSVVAVEELKQVEKAVVTNISDISNYDALSKADSLNPYVLEAERQYGKQTEKQVYALLQLTDYNVEDVQCCFVSVEGENNQSQMMIHILLTQADKKEQSKVQTAISGYFGLDLSQVQIEVCKEAEGSGRRTEETND